ncbi:MAG: glycosyltransferase family 2 protein [Patescibacteria group bacterium]|nr:glycosyltransferase family 2 protein [Patescibacteria group bacterium]
MLQNNNTISFVIVNYNSKKELHRCLTDLSKINDAQNFEIIIINNDKKSLTLPQYKFAKQSVYEINKNIGYGCASNIGLSHANNRFVCFLNPDTHSFCNDLAKITTHLTHNKMIVAPQIRTQSNAVELWSVGEDITLLQTLKNNCGLNKKIWLTQNKISVDWVSGAAMIASKKFLTELGGFDEDFFLYFEDVDLCKRAINCGGKIQYIPQYFLTHINGASSGTNVQKQKKCYYTSQDLFFHKHYGASQKHFLRFCRLFQSK